MKTKTFDKHAQAHAFMNFFVESLSNEFLLIVEIYTFKSHHHDMQFLRYIISCNKPFCNYNTFIFLVSKEINRLCSETFFEEAKILFSA